ncbi:MAG: glycosyltransferase [Candidatus Woesearchaeota archaeon]
MVKISMVIPACNEEKYIEKTLQRIQEQNDPEVETIVVCNGCSDNTETLAKKVANQSTKIISFKEGHVSKARNIGAQKAEGDILFFLDADSLISDNTFSQIKEGFQEKHAVATTKVQPDVPQLKYRLAMGFKNFYNTTNLYQGCSGALICRKEDFDKVDGYDASLKVKEHRKLIIKLKRSTGKEFTCLDTNITTSMRRFQQWGLAKATFFWLGQWVKNYLGDLKDSEYEKVR